MIVIYSKNNCPSCERLKAILTQHGVAFEVKNIDNDLSAMDFVVEQNHRAMPVVYRNGEHVRDPSSLT